MTSRELTPEIAFQIDFNLQMVPAAQGLPVPAAAGAAMLGTTEARWLVYEDQVAAAVRQAATALQERPAVAAKIDGWPVHPGGKILAIGDSITTYRYSYARLLAELMALRRPADNVQVLNGAQSGYTSSHGLEATYTQFLPETPDWVLVKYGVNDCKRFGGPEARTLVTPGEYRANLGAIVDAFQRFTQAKVVLITPAPVVEEVANTLPDFVAMRMIWRNTDIAERAGFLRELAESRGLPLVDLVEVFGLDPDPAYYLPDGLHPNPAGQEIMLDAVLAALPW